MLNTTLIGNIGKDAVLNNVNGKNVINFSIAHNEKYKDQNGVEINKTLWISCALWVEKTGILPYLKRGTLVYVEGKPDAKIYTGQDGKSVANLHLRVSHIELLSSKKENENG